MITSAISSAYTGIQQNISMLNRAAEQIASYPVDVENVAVNAIEMKLAKLGVAANASVIRVADEMSGELVDLFL